MSKSSDLQTADSGFASLFMSPRPIFPLDEVREKTLLHLPSRGECRGGLNDSTLENRPLCDSRERNESDEIRDGSRYIVARVTLLFTLFTSPSSVKISFAHIERAREVRFPRLRLRLPRYQASDFRR